MPIPSQGYWKDVGTIDSLWEANMELLQNSPDLDLYDNGWKIYSRNPNPAAALCERGRGNQEQHDFGRAVIFTERWKTAFSSRERLSRRAPCVKDSIIMADTVIGSGSSVIKSILDEDVRVGKNCMIGGEEAIAVIGSGVNIGDDKTIAAGEMIEPLATI